MEVQHCVWVMHFYN